MKRQPLRRDLDSASLALSRVVRRWERLAEDERFRQAAQKSPWTQRDLLWAADELRRIAETIDPSQGSQP